MPLHYSSNPVYVYTEYGFEIDEALLLMQNAISNASSVNWYLYVTDNSGVPNSVQYGSSYSSTQRVPDQSGSRILSFTIFWNPGLNWCTDTGDYPTSCEALTYGFFDAMVHESGHAIGMNHCENICSDSNFRNLPADEEIVAFPTMAGGGDNSFVSCGCDGLHCGWVSPANLMRDLATADYNAINSLYSGVVRNSGPIQSANINGNILTLSLESFLCGGEYKILAAKDPQSDMVVIGSGKAGGVTGEYCQLEITIDNQQDLGFVWILDKVSHFQYGPVNLEGEIPEVSLTSRGPDIIAYPNPFNPRVEIHILPGDRGDKTNVIVSVHDIRGLLVRRLYSGIPDSQGESIVWDGIREDGRPVASGQYFIIMRGMGVWENKKISLVR